MISTSAKPSDLRRDEEAGGEARRPRVERVSVIIPVKDEEASIEALLRALVTQTRPPAEIVITDGGSGDRTKELIRAFQQSSPVPIVLIEAADSLPGRGRNLAIRRAAHEWLAAIDAGIVPRRDWLAELILTAEDAPPSRVVWGRYETVANSYFTECAAITYLPPPDQPGRRSIASCLMHRSAWEEAGGFREDLRSSEDLLFFRSLAAARVPEAFSARAVVDWELQPDLARTFRRFVVYSRNGMKAGLAAEWQLNVARFYLLLLALTLAGAFFFWPLLLLSPTIFVLRAWRRIRGWYRGAAPGRLLAETLNPRRVLTVTWLNIVIDLATFYGVWLWLRHDFLRQEPAAGQKQSGV